VEIPTGESRFRPLQLLLPSSTRKSDTWDSRSKHVPVQWRYGIGASGIRTGATYRNGCLRSGESRWIPTSVARRDPPIKPALLAESRLVRYGEKKGKMPYEEFRKLFEQRPEYPIVGRESHSAAQLSGHWRAGYALLPCCWCGEAEPIPLTALEDFTRKA